jgi:hypothetical protein
MRRRARGGGLLTGYLALALRIFVALLAAHALRR